MIAKKKKKDPNAVALGKKGGKARIERMTPEQKALLLASYQRLAPMSETAAQLFYSRLFELDPSLIKALQARSRRERISVSRLVKRLIADGLQEVADYEAIKAFRSRPGRPVALVEVKKRLGLDRPARRRR